jgi:hypothetical protein
MKSSKTQTRDNLAGTPNLLDALKDLANLQDDAASFERFAHRWRRWPVFAQVGDDNPSDNDMGFSYGEPWTRMPPSIPKRFFTIWQDREALREIWRGNSKKLAQVLLPPADILSHPDLDPEGVLPPQLEVNWQRGEFVYVPRNEFQGAVHQLFRRSALAKFCANPDCPAPYFIAGRTTQQYCSEKCFGVLQQAHKRQWWKEHGNEWRRDRSRRKRGKG